MWLLRLFFEYTNFKDALIEKNVYVVKKIINKKLMKNKKTNFLMQSNFLNNTIIDLFYFYKKMFVLTNI